MRLDKGLPGKDPNETTRAPLGASASRNEAEAPEVTFSVERLDPLALQELWTDLERRAEITFFLSWFWIGTWVELAGAPDFVLIGRAGGEVVCLGLLRKKVQWRHRVLRSRTLFLNQSGNPEEDVICIEYNGFLCDRRFRGIQVEALAYLRQSSAVGKFDELQMGGVTEDVYEEACKLGCAIHVSSLKQSAYVDLKSIRDNGQDYLDTVSANTRYQIRRAVKIYKNRGPLSVQPARTTSEALQFLDELGILHEAIWRKRGPGGAWRFPFLVAFHKRLIEKAFPSGGIDIVKISCGDKPIGYIHCLVRDGWIGSYLSGFAYEEDNKIKPGLVSFYLYIQHKLETSGDTFDFLAGDHRYKTSLGQSGQLMYTFRIQERRLQLLVEQGLRYAKGRARAILKRRSSGFETA